MPAKVSFNIPRGALEALREAAEREGDPEPKAEAVLDALKAASASPDRDGEAFAEAREAVRGVLFPPCPSSPRSVPKFGRVVDTSVPRLWPLVVRARRAALVDARYRLADAEEAVSEARARVRAVRRRGGDTREAIERLRGRIAEMEAAKRALEISESRAKGLPDVS